MKNVSQCEPPLPNTSAIVRVKLPKWYLMEREVLNAWNTIKTKMYHCPGESQASQWGGCSAKVLLLTCPVLALAGGSYCEQSAKWHVAFSTRGWKWQGWVSSLLGLWCSGGKGEWLSSGTQARKSHSAVTMMHGKRHVVEAGEQRSH